LRSWQEPPPFSTKLRRVSTDEPGGILAESARENASAFGNPSSEQHVEGNVFAMIAGAARQSKTNKEHNGCASPTQVHNACAKRPLPRCN